MYDRQWFVLNIDQVERIFSDITVICHDKGNSFTNIANLIKSQRKLCTWLCQSIMGHKQRRRLKHFSKVGGSEHKMHARQFTSSIRINIQDTCPRMCTAQNSSMQLFR